MADIAIKTNNLFDLATTRTQFSCDVSISDNTVTQANTGGFARSQWLFELVSGNTYTIKVNYNNPNGCSLRVNILDDNSQTYRQSEITTDSTGYIILTFTAQSNSTYIRLYSNTLGTAVFDTVEFYDIMLNAGETAQSFMPGSSTGWAHSLKKFDGAAWQNATVHEF